MGGAVTTGRVVMYKLRLPPAPIRNHFRAPGVQLDCRPLLITHPYDPRIRIRAKPGHDPAKEAGQYARYPGGIVNGDRIMMDHPYHPVQTDIRLIYDLG
ncbi:hypothetical protein GCM10011352_29650 [Marinobacterium zhoushanense]|uniref:Uncharacterized protein n=1 Tax=Marinobacterium zhoushanense TaxID=1679163 RepID=A0ABQ1KMG5_9GAMM|nr:hypothetical protein GCM10011352_29650 [Marinobacterium zhoushanense]